MKCGMCGRTLKGTKSIERGYGPVCYGKIRPSSAASKISYQEGENYNVPGQMEIDEFIDISRVVLMSK